MKKIKSVTAILSVIIFLFSVSSCGKTTQNETTTVLTQQSTVSAETANANTGSVFESKAESSAASSSSQETATNSITQTEAESSDTTSNVNTTTQQTTQNDTTRNQTQSKETAKTETQVETQATINTTTQAQSQAETQTVNTTEVQQTQSTTVPPQQAASTKEVHQTDNGTYYVYYPESIETSKETYPVLSWANGTMCPQDMYVSLLTEIANGGYIVIASDETMAADGAAQITALDFAVSLNNDSASLAYKKTDTTKFGVIGHSQGGRSSVNAAVKDSRIKCVVSVAGSNFLEEAEPNSTPTFFIAGENDMIVSPSKWIQPAYDVAKGPAVYASLNGAIHTTCCTDPGKYSSYILNWCDAWLKNDTKALQTFSSNGPLSSDSSWSDFQCKGF